jgi:Domain of unknown function (DUF1707)
MLRRHFDRSVKIAFDRPLKRRPLAAVEPLAVQPPQPLRASDADRERTVAILREHWQAGRLTLAEFEARCEEAWGARMVSGLWQAVRELPVPVPAVPPVRAEASPRAGAAVGSFVLGVIGACVLLVSFGFFAVLSTPLSVVAWVLGRSARRGGATAGHRSLAVAGEVLGVGGTIMGGLVVAAFALFFLSL